MRMCSFGILPSVLLMTVSISAPAAAAAEPAAEAAANGYIAEAALPAGWPAPAMPGGITEADIPAHRAAEGPGFWRLFAHISVGGIPMTAPVVMPAVDEAGNQGSAMRFLYPSSTTQPAPTLPGITIVDVPAQRVLRATVRGPVGPGVLRERIAALTTEAAARKLKTGGKPMLCGYNGPSVAAAERTWEVFLPVTAE